MLLQGYLYFFLFFVFTLVGQFFSGQTLYPSPSTHPPLPLPQLVFVAVYWVSWGIWASVRSTKPADHREALPVADGDVEALRAASRRSTSSPASRANPLSRARRLRNPRRPIASPIRDLEYKKRSSVWKWADMPSLFSRAGDQMNVVDIR